MVSTMIALTEVTIAKSQNKNASADNVYSFVSPEGEQRPYFPVTNKTTAVTTAFANDQGSIVFQPKSIN